MSTMQVLQDKKKERKKKKKKVPGRNISVSHVAPVNVLRNAKRGAPQLLHRLALIRSCASVSSL